MSRHGTTVRRVRKLLDRRLPPRASSAASARQTQASESRPLQSSWRWPVGLVVLQPLVEPAVEEVPADHEHQEEAGRVRIAETKEVSQIPPLVGSPGQS
jgi:hypothetical protein